MSAGGRPRIATTSASISRMVARSSSSAPTEPLGIGAEVVGDEVGSTLCAGHRPAPDAVRKAHRHHGDADDEEHGDADRDQALAG